MGCLSLAVWYLQGFLTPVIAIIAVYIAWQQSKTNKLKLRLDKYDRRLRVYQEIIKVLSVEVRDADVKLDDLVKFRAETAEADFLFDPDIPTYVDQIYQHGLKIWHANTERREKTPGSYMPGAVAEELNSELKWILAQFAVAKEKFRKYLDISK